MSLLRSVLGPFSREHSFLDLDLTFTPNFAFPFLCDVKQLKTVINEVFLDCFVKRSVGRKGWCVVDLQYLRVELMVQNYIESQYLKTHVVCKILRMTPLLESAQIGVSSDDCLDQHVVNSLLNLFAVMAQFIEGLVN